MTGNGPEFTRRGVLGVSGAAAAALAVRPVFGLALEPTSGTVPAFIERLIRQMTLEEKAGQLNLLASAIAGSAALSINPTNNAARADEQIAAVRAGRLTGVFNGGGEYLARLQRAAAQSRLKIPV